MWGFALEMVYGLLCWWLYRGRRSLLAVIVFGNLANITLFSAAIPGPEEYLAGHPLMVVTVVFVQIVVTLTLVGVLAEETVPRRRHHPRGVGPDVARPLEGPR
jgi:arginine exporter protein ArgO